MDYINDRQLVANYLGGDRQAFTLIVRRHRKRMYFAARNFARNEQDAQDIVQDALFKAARSLHTYRGEAKLSTWLHRMTINAAIDHQRKDGRAGAQYSLDDNDHVDIDANKYLAYNPMENMERTMAMRQALAVLPQAQRKALWLIDVAGMSVGDAAAELGVQPGTVKSRRYRAREAVAAGSDAQAEGCGQARSTAVLMDAFAGAGTVVRGNATFGMFSNHAESIDDALRQRAVGAAPAAVRHRGAFRHGRFDEGQCLVHLVARHQRAHGGAHVERETGEGSLGHVMADDAFGDEPHRVRFANEGSAEGERDGFDDPRRRRNARDEQEPVDGRADHRAGRRQDEEAGGDVLRPEPPAIQQRMTGPHGEAQGFGIERLEVEARHRLRLGHSADDDVELAFAKKVQKMIVRTRHDAGNRAEAFAEKQADRLWHQAGRDGRQGSDPQGQGGRIACRGEGAGALVEAVQPRLGMAQEERAETGQRDGPARAVEQRHAQKRLQFAQGLGDGGLGDVQGARGARHGAGARDGHEGREMPKTHGGIESHSLPLGYQIGTKPHFT